MNYELAKKLKDNGFKQEGLWGIVYLPEKVSTSNSRVKYRRKEQHKIFPWHKMGGFLTGGYEPVLLPTLSELIEACGDRFVSLDKGMFLNQWHCVGNGAESGGTTAEEAVLHLWIALNEKKS